MENSVNNWGMPVSAVVGGGGSGGGPTQIIVVLNSLPVTIPSGVGTVIPFDTISFQKGTDFTLGAGGVVNTGANVSFVSVEAQVFMDENATGSRVVIPIPAIPYEFIGLIGGFYSPKQLCSAAGFNTNAGAAGLEVAQNSGVDLTIGAFDAYFQVAGW